MMIRPFEHKDAKGWIECHFSAVHTLGIHDYPQAVCNQWSPPVDDRRIQKLLNTRDDSFRFVADVDGVVAGFAEYMPADNQLGVCYVHADYVGQGIGKALMEQIETHAKSHGVVFLAFDSSITAVPFYKRMGYDVIESGSHSLSSGLKMACFKMRKDL